MKRILIVNSQSIYKNNATGITLRSIVSALQEYEIMEIHRYQPRNCIDGELGIKCLQIPPQSMPMNYVVRKFSGLDNYRDKGESVSKPGENANDESIKKCFRKNFKTFLENSLIIPEPHFIKIIDEFDPDIIYTMGASVFIHKWALFLSRRYHSPIVMHYMDNWRQTLFSNSKKLRYSKKILEKQLKELEGRMKAGLTISPGMAEAYHLRYGKTYYPLMNTVSPLCIADPPSYLVNIVYAGGLHLNRYQSLLDVSNAIADMDNVSLLIYTSEENRKRYEALFEAENTSFMPAVSHDKISEVYERANVLLHIESFDKSVIAFTQYSLSTKIPEYMSSGRPILCYAPRTIEAYKYIHSSGAGICIDEKEKLKAAVVELLDDNKRHEMGEKGGFYAEHFHSVSKLRETISRVISESV